MDIKIRKPIGFSEIGKKENQEDAVWPRFEATGENQKVIILCDGMGGHAHGEVASQTMAQALGQALTEKTAENEAVTDDIFQAALSAGYDALDAADTDDGERKMGTTLTCVCFGPAGCLAAHIGDSRIYQIRPGKGIVYQSSDHSWVNMMVKLGEMTPQEAAHHPRRNVILRACQPHAEKRAQAEIHHLENIKGGDYFFLCCDGILEQLSDVRLFEILSMDVDDEKKLALIKEECYGKTRDNFTCYLIPVDEVTGAEQATDEGLVPPQPDKGVEFDVVLDTPNDNLPVVELKPEQINKPAKTHKPNRAKETPSLFRLPLTKEQLLLMVLSVFLFLAVFGIMLRGCKPAKRHARRPKVAFVADNTRLAYDRTIFDCSKLSLKSNYRNE